MIGTRNARDTNESSGGKSPMSDARARARRGWRSAGHRSGVGEVDEGTQLVELS